MRALNAMTLATAIALAPTIAVAAQREATAAEEMKAVRAMAAAIPLGSRVKVQSRSGRRLTATLMAVTDEAIVVKREARVPEPAVTIRYDELARLDDVRLIDPGALSYVESFIIRGLNDLPVRFRRRS